MANQILASKEELLESKTFVKQGSIVELPSPSMVLTPFLNITENIVGGQYVVKTSNSVINKNDDESDNVAYGRFNLEYKLPAMFDTDNSFYTLGIVCGLDTQKPIVKVYGGHRVSACTNLTVFNAEQVFTQELTGNVNMCYEKITKYFQTIEEQNREYISTVRTLTQRVLDEQQIHERIGKLMEFGIRNPRLGTTVIIDGIKEMLNPKSVYAIKNGSTTDWNILNSVTEFVSSKADILDESTKALLIGEFMTSVDKLKSSLISID